MKFHNLFNVFALISICVLALGYVHSQEDEQQQQQIDPELQELLKPTQDTIAYIMENLSEACKDEFTSVLSQGADAKLSAACQGEVSPLYMSSPQGQKLQGMMNERKMKQYGSEGASATAGDKSSSSSSSTKDVSSNKSDPTLIIFITVAILFGSFFGAGYMKYKEHQKLLESMPQKKVKNKGAKHEKKVKELERRKQARVVSVE